MDNWRDLHIAAGYFLARPFQPVAGRFSTRVPADIITASDCLAAIGPGPWALPWMNLPDKDRSAQATALGLSEDQLPAIQRWVEAAMGRGEWGWPNVFLSLDALWSFTAEFEPQADDLRVVGLALATTAAGDFLAEHPDRVDPPLATPGVVEAVRRQGPPSAKGVPLGYEPLGEESGGTFHSWYCNDLEPLMHERLGINVNDHGLISDREDAEAVAALLDGGSVGCEPVPWRAYLLIDYPLH